MVSRFCVRPTSNMWFLQMSPSDHETWSNWCHAGINVSSTSILQSLTSNSPSTVVWSSEVGPAPPLPPMRVLEVRWSRAPSLVCDVALHRKLLASNTPNIQTSILNLVWDHNSLRRWGSCEVAKLDRPRLFHQWECLKCSRHGLSVSCATWPFIESYSPPTHQTFKQAY